MLVEHLDWLSRQARSGDGAVAARAQILLDECRPTVEDDVAARIAGGDAWGDTFLLWTFVRRPRALSLAPGLVAAVAARYASRAARSGGLVRGRSFPFHDQPMPSATAHLASAAVRTGEGLELVPAALSWLRSQRRTDGGWGDPGQESDPLTTLAVAELLGMLDPSFDPGGALDAIIGPAGGSAGRPGVIGPEWPWVAAEMLAFAHASERPFRERFRWPHVPRWMVDERVAVPRFEAYLVDARLFETVDGLRHVPVDVGFVDMAGFGAWNSVHGQAAGDEMLALLAAQLKTLPDSRTIRDGGDEFLVLGAPMANGLADRLAAMFGRWPQVSLERWPDLPVVPLRAVVTSTEAGSLRRAREQLGIWIGEVKRDFPAPGPEGIVRVRA